MRHWVIGNQFTLLENGEAFFPRVFECIAAAEREVVLETFIWFDDKVGQQLQAALITAGQRGVQVDVTIDDYGAAIADVFHALGKATRTCCPEAMVFEAKHILLAG